MVEPGTSLTTTAVVPPPDPRLILRGHPQEPFTPAYGLRGENVSIQANPAFSFAIISLDAGGEVQTEAGAMAAMSDGVELETKGRLWMQTRTSTRT